MSARIATFSESRPIEDWLRTEREAGRLTGGVLEIRQNGAKVFSKTFGARDAAGRPVTRKTSYWIASMTKPIVSVAAMALIERGKLKLSDPIRDFIPGFGKQGALTVDGSTEEIVRPPVVLDLLTHLSGVTYGAFGNDEIHDRYKGKRVYDFFSDNAQMAERLCELPLLHQPGRVFEYGMSTDLLGRVLEVVTGAPLDQVLRKYVLNPLEMRDTGFFPAEGTSAEIPPSATQKALAPPVSSGHSWQSGGGGLFSTVPDYARFAEMLRQGGTLHGKQVLRADTLQLMLHDHLPEAVGYGAYTSTLGITAPVPENGLGFGLGLAVRMRPSKHVRGGLGEFFWPGVSGTNFWVDPEIGLIAILLTHAPDHRAEHRIGFRNAVYAGLK